MFRKERIMKRHYIIKKISLLSIYLVIISFGCSEKLITPTIEESNQYDNLKFSDKIQLISYPTFGSFKTTFRFNLLINDNSLKIIKVKYDFTHDNNYDTSLTILDTAKTKFTNYGYNKIIASVFLENDSVISCSTEVWLTEPKIISSDGGVYFEPNIYNGKFISVTHGIGHQAQFIDLNTYEMECFFCGFPSDRFYEMHVSMPSFDGKKLLFDNGTNYRFCYYDLEVNDTTNLDIPLNVLTYPVGQITWSLDNKNIFGIEYDENYHLNIIKSYNIETHEINSVYEKGDYICVIPDQVEKLAILEKVDINQSKLIIYNVTTKTIEKEYDSIPFYAPFRMLRNSDRVYFDGELAFYSLNLKTIYTIQFDELNLENHMYGEADINMDGDKFIIGTWNENRALYEIILPRFF